MQVVHRSLSHAANAFLRVRFLCWSMALDALFVLLFGIVSAAYTTRIGDYLFLLAGNLARAQALPSASRNTGALLLEAGAPKLLAVTAVLLILFFLTLFILFVLVEGTAWWTAARAGGNAEAWKKHLRSFFRATVPWAVFFFLLQLTNYGVSLFQRLARHPRGTATHPVLWVLFLLILYAAGISFALLPHRERMRTVLRRCAMPSCLLGFGAALAVFFLLDKLLALLSFHPAAMLVGGFLLLLPLLYGTRVFLYALVRQKK